MQVSGFNRGDSEHRTDTRTRSSEDENLSTKPVFALQLFLLSFRDRSRGDFFNKHADDMVRSLTVFAGNPIEGGLFEVPAKPVIPIDREDY